MHSCRRTLRMLRKPRQRLIKLLVFWLLCIPIIVESQIYHPKTGKVIPVAKPSITPWKNGVFNGYNANYATLVVKENHANPNSSLITVPLIQIPSHHSTDKPPVFILNGGPGESNLQGHLLFDKIVEYHDVYLLGYRGVDGSVQLNCPQMTRALFCDTLSLKNADQIFSLAMKSCIDSLKETGIDIEGYSMDQVIKDIEFVRNELSIDKISFYSFSYGTMLAQLYSRTYPDNTDKIVFIGARPLNQFLFSSEVYTRQISQLFDFLLPENDKNSDDINLMNEKIEKVLSGVQGDYEAFNEYRLLFFGFSKLYNIEGINNLIEAYRQAYEGNPAALLQLYREFYNNYPGKIALGDIYLKKQGRIWFPRKTANSSIGEKTMYTVNTWYSPEIDLLEANFPTVFNDSLNMPALFICGALDVASPHEYILGTDYFGYSNHTLKIFPNSGHLDLFYKDKQGVEEEIFEFLNK